MSGGGWEDGVPKNALRLRGVFYIPPHQRHKSSPAPANGWSQAPFPVRYPGQRPARHQRGRCRPSPRQPNLFAVAADEFNDLRISETVDVASGGFNGAVNGIDFDAYDDIPVETSGTDVPPQARTFDEIDLGEALCRNIRRCRYVKPTPVQRYAIPISLAGRDLMACAQTGSGKTAAFCFPIISGIMKSFSAATQSGRLCGNLLACPRALILCPTRELSCQIHDEAKKFSYQTGVKVCVVYGGAPAGRQLRELEKGVDILVATPGRLLDLIERARVSLQKVYYLALDEADRMLDMGFEHQIRKIVEQMDMPPRGARQTMLFSATFPNEIQRLASDFLSNYIFLAVGRVGSSTELIKQRIEYVSDKEKRNHLIDLLHAQNVNYSVGKKPLTLIFVETKRGVDSLQNWLRMNGFPTTSIHGDRIQYEREQALKSFKCGATPIMVATDVAARGLDIPHVAHVINFDLPKDIIDYVHRIGRTGRAGKCGLATAFFSDSNQPLAKALAELMQESSQEIPGWLSQFAEKCCFEERNRRCGGSKYAGHEFRHDGMAKRGLDNSNTYSDVLHSNCVSDGGDIKSGCSRDGSDGCTGGVSSVVGFDDTAYRTMAYGIGYDQIVATGWD